MTAAWVKPRLLHHSRNPIVIRAEDGLQALPNGQRPDAFPVLESESQLWEQLTTLIKEDHPYQTLVIDSVTALERLFMQSVVDSDPKKPKSINQAMGGYGAGLMAVGGFASTCSQSVRDLKRKAWNAYCIYCTC